MNQYLIMLTSVGNRSISSEERILYFLNRLETIWIEKKEGEIEQSHERRTDEQNSIFSKDRNKNRSCRETQSIAAHVYNELGTILIFSSIKLRDTLSSLRNIGPLNLDNRTFECPIP